MRALLLLALLAGCGRETAVAPPAAPPAASFREAGRVIASTTRGGPSDIEGEWVVSQTYPGTFGGLVEPGSLVGISGPDQGGQYGWVIQNLHNSALPLYLTRPASPGRFDGVNGGPTFWVLWVDDDFRTAVIGTPDGSFGWVMDRPGEASPDRTEAARRMLEFNGYDLSRLVP